MIRAIALGLLAGVIVFLLGLSGCSQEPMGPPIADPEVTHSQPDEFGVVCYWRYSGSANLSCVQVQEGHR